MIKYTPSTEVDFLVIGSGAGGAVMAKELAVAGFSVVVLEQGPWGDYGHEQDFNKDELNNRYPDCLLYTSIFQGRGAGAASHALILI